MSQDTFDRARPRPFHENSRSANGKSRGSNLFPPLRYISRSEGFPGRRQLHFSVSLGKRGTLEVDSLDTTTCMKLIRSFWTLHMLRIVVFRFPAGWPQTFSTPTPWYP